MKKWFTCLLMFAPFVPHALEATTFTLNNGMNAVLVEDHRAPVVVHSVWYPIGSLDEPAGKTGIAHMLEHMMFKGTPTVPAGQFSKIVAHNGGQDNAFTSREYTAYYQKISAQKLPLVMEMEADRMENLDISDATFQPERDVVLEERSLRVDGQPIRRFFEKLVQKHSPATPAGNPVIGWRKDIENYTVADAVNWYEAYYTPSHATLLVVGSVKPEDFKKLAEKYYAPLKRRDVNVPPTPAQPFFDEHQRLELVDNTVKVPVFYRLYRAPSLFAPVAGEGETTLKDAVALSLLAEVFGNSETGGLYRALVEDKKLADAASMSYDAVGRVESSVDVFVQPKPGVTLKRIEEEVDAEIAKLLHHGVHQEDLSRAKVKLAANHVYSRDDLFRSAYMLGRWLMAGGTPENFDDWLHILQSITQEDLKQVAHKYLDYHQATTGLLKTK